MYTHYTVSTSNVTHNTNLPLPIYNETLYYILYISNIKVVYDLTW